MGIGIVKGSSTNRVEQFGSWGGMSRVGGIVLELRGGGDMEKLQQIFLFFYFFFSGTAINPCKNLCNFVTLTFFLVLTIKPPILFSIFCKQIVPCTNSLW